MWFLILSISRRSRISPRVFLDGRESLREYFATIENHSESISRWSRITQSDSWLSRTTLRVIFLPSRNILKVILNRREKLGAILDRREILLECFSTVEKYSRSDSRPWRNTLCVILYRREILPEWFLIFAKYSGSNSRPPWNMSDDIYLGILAQLVVMELARS